MVLESTMILIDNSEYQRNGDYIPTRLSAQKECISLVCHAKLRSHPENNVGIMTISDNVEVLATLTTDISRIYTKMQRVQPKGNINLITGIKIAHLVLRHRQNRNHRMRIVAFIGSPLNNKSDELITLAKRLKKEKVNIDCVLFGEHNENLKLMTAFLNTINGKDGNSSHLLCVNRDTNFSDVLLSSPIVQGEDGQGGVERRMDGYEFGFDPNEDPELALALRISLEEETQRTLTEQSMSVDQSRIAEQPNSTLQQQPIMESLELNDNLNINNNEINENENNPIEQNVDLSNMNEEEQIAYALQMSLDGVTFDQNGESISNANNASTMKADEDIHEEMDIDTDNKTTNKKPNKK